MVLMDIGGMGAHGTTNHERDLLMVRLLDTKGCSICNSVFQGFWGLEAPTKYPGEQMGIRGHPLDVMRRDESHLEFLCRYGTFQAGRRPLADK